MAEARDMLAKMDGLLTTLYDDIHADTPWTKAQELLRVRMQANSVCLRMVQTASRHREHLFAAGPLVNQHTIAEWENWANGELGPVPLKPGEHCVVDWSNQNLDPALADMLSRFGTRTMLTMCIDKFGGMEYYLNCDRGSTAPEFDTQDIAFFRMAGGHFGRALGLRRKLATYHALSQFKSQALDRLSTAIFMITPLGEFHALNESAQRHVAAGDFFFARNRNLHLHDQYADRKLQESIRSLIRADGEPSSRILSVSAPETDRKLDLLIVAMPTHSLLTDKSETCALLFVRDDISLRYEDVSLLQTLFSLTPTEAKITIDLANGRRIDQISTMLDISKHTVRAHLRSIFQKMGINRQADVVHVLSNSVIPLGRRSPAFAAGGCDGKPRLRSSPG